jgi:sarcosine oxidase, subunit gamma
MASPAPRRALADHGRTEPFVIEGTGVTFREVSSPTLVNLRGDPSDPGFMAEAANVLGAAPPTLPNTVAAAGGIEILWLGPDEWLVVAQPPSGDLARRLDGALAAHHHAATDVSASRVVVEIAGAQARAVLATGIRLDLHPRVFGPGRCAQTGLVGVPVILHVTGDSPSFRLYLRNSFASYVVAWLAGAVTALTEN